MKRLKLLLILFFTISFFPQIASAHKPSDSYLRVDYKVNSVAIHWDVALKDLEYIIGLDINQDRSITWGEVKQRRKAILDFAASGLKLTGKESECKLDFSPELQIDHHSDGAYAVIRARGKCAESGPLKLHYSLFFDSDAGHRGIAMIQRNGSSVPVIFSPESPTYTLSVQEQDPQFIGHFLFQGMDHIWKGFDHILFLVVLLLPSVLTAASGFEKPVEKFWPAFITMLKVVTAFTVAHCVTLSLVAFDVLTISPYLVEGLVAFTILLTAINNLLAVIKESFWIVCGLFGLIHGFAFATVLQDLKLPLNELLLALLGFNLGVEAGQIVIVAVIFPLCFFLRKTALYRKLLFIGGSGIAAAVAFLWMLERFFNLQLLVL